MGMPGEKLREDVVVVMDQILIADGVGKRVYSAVAEANSFRKECAVVGSLVDGLRLMLHNLVGSISAAPPPVYDRPIVRIVAEVSKNLERALSLVRKCKYRKCKRLTLFGRFVIGNRTTDFSRIFALLESSIADMQWLLSLFDPDTGCAAWEGNLSLPPIAIDDPVISSVWSFISILKMGQLKHRIEAASNLASLAQENERNKRFIEEEGGIPPLINLLKENFPPEAQITAANALYILSDDEERVRTITTGGGIPAIVQLLRASPIRVQIQAASLVARLAEKYPKAQEAFAEEHVVVPLVKLLFFEIHSRYINLCLDWFSEWSNPAKMQKEQWETETPEVKLLLKLNCSKALWVLATGNESICKNITERNGLMCLAKLMEKETDELQLNCLMIVREITAAAEQHPNFRRLAFKTNFPDVRALVNELLRVIKESEGPELQIPAIRSIGSLARIFPAREIRVIESLVAQIRNKHREVAEEAVIALQKFVCKDHFLRWEHSKSIIELNGVAALLRLIEKASKQAIVLLRHLEEVLNLKLYSCPKTVEKFGSTRQRDMTPGNPPNALENLPNSKAASSIGPNVETKRPMSKSKTQDPSALLRLTIVIGPCSCTYSGLLSILAKRNFIPDNFQAFGAYEFVSWFTSLFAIGIYKKCILTIIWRGISFEVFASWFANTISFQIIKIETFRNSMYYYLWRSLLKI